MKLPNSLSAIMAVGKRGDVQPIDNPDLVGLHGDLFNQGTDDVLPCSPIRLIQARADLGSEFIDAG